MGEEKTQYLEARNAILEAENQLLELEIERLKLAELLSKRKTIAFVLTTALAFITVGLLFCQIIAMREQNKVILDDSTRARRAQLIATIYDQKDCGEEDCPPKAHIRSRAEAALALVELDREIGRKPSLAKAVLNRAYLKGANLQGVDLYKVVLVDADLEDAILHEANLIGADLRGARLWGANLQDANLMLANLKEARLNRANLKEATLRWVTLGGALMEGAINLTNIQLENSIIDNDTELPVYFRFNHREALLESSQRNIKERDRFLEQFSITHDMGAYLIRP